MAVSMQYSAVSQRYGIPEEHFPLNKQQILQTLRVIQESTHQGNVFSYSALRHWLLTSFHKPVDFDSISGLRLEDANASCNRTAPIFVLRDNTYPEDGPLNAIPGFDLCRHQIRSDTTPLRLEGLLAHMHIYIYGRWMRPYESVIDRGQFLTKVNLPAPMSLPPTCSLGMVDLVRKMSTNLIARIKHTKAEEVSDEEQDAGQSILLSATTL